MTSNYDKFNQQAEEFLIKMSNTFPNESKISEMKMYFDMRRFIGKENPINDFMYYLEPYGLQIMSKDVAFFQRDAFVKNAESLSEKMGLINHWAALNDATKESIWSYFQVLYVIGMQTFNKKAELKQIFDKISGKNLEYDGRNI